MMLCGRRRSLACVILLLVFSISCGEKSSADKLKAELQTVFSWTATAQMVVEAWTQGTIPAACARRTLETARDTFEQEDKSINELFDASPELRADAFNSLQELKQSILRMQKGIEQSNRGQVEAEIGKLKMEIQVIKSLLLKLGE